VLLPLDDQVGVEAEDAIVALARALESAHDAYLPRGPASAGAAIATVSMSAAPRAEHCLIVLKSTPVLLALQAGAGSVPARSHAEQ